MAIPGVKGSRKVRVDGLTEAKAALAFIPEAVREEFAAMIRETAENVEQLARSAAPRRDGDLKASIATNIREDGLQAAIGSNLYYAKFVEFGTVRTRKRPFLYPAFRLAVRQFRIGAKEAGVKIRNKVKRRYKGPKKA